jgi:hypothetical protein
VDGKLEWKSMLAAEYPAGLCESLAETYAKAVVDQPQNTPVEVKIDLQGVHNPVEADSKKRRHNIEAKSCVGGLRNPVEAMGKVPGLREMGKRVRACLWPLLVENPERVGKLVNLIGNSEATGFPQELVAQARERLAAEFKTKPDGGAAGVQGWLYKALLGGADDPEQQVPEWLRTFTPLGIERPIIPSGIFPEVEPQGVGPALEKLMAVYANKAGATEANYSSYEENKAEADQQLDSEREKGYLEWAASREELEAKYGTLILSRMGAILSLKDGKRKVRLIHDLKRSLVNTKVTICERLVLPGLTDLVNDVLDLLDHLKPRRRH